MERKELIFIVPPECGGMNANVFLKKHCKVSARMIARLKREKNGIIRDDKILRTIDTLNAGDKIILNIPADKNDIVPTEGSLNILFEDDYVIVLDKPSNTPVHPTKVHQTDTLANFLAFRQLKTGERFTFRAINRLDKDTSGIVVVAKDCYTANLLFKSLNKTYLAICEGIIREKGTINKPIRLLEGHTIQRTAAFDGKPSVTHYTPVMHTDRHTLLNIVLETGHTHQIRCHFSSIGCPLAGDDMYGGSLEYITRQALHCNFVSFVHPITGKVIKIKSEMPEDMKNLLK